MSFIEHESTGTQTPLIKGDTATFLWRGETAPALIGDFTGWEERPIDLERVQDGVWERAVGFPPDAYLEYSFWQHGERVADPLNPRTTPDGCGHDNHYFYMPVGAPTPLARRRRNVPHGEVTRHVIEEGFFLSGTRRRVDLYRPPADGPYPLLVVFDGGEAQRRARLANIVDNLIAEKRMRPVALAMVHNGRSARGVEYACSEATLCLLLGHVLPLAQQELDLIDIQIAPHTEATLDRGPHGIMGASMGGLMALFAALRLPAVFGHVLSLSGAFTLSDYDLVLWDLVRYLPVRPLRLWLGAGRFEWLLEPNRRMRALMVARGYKPAYHEFNAGHNYPAWRDHLWRGLEHLFPPVEPHP